MAVITTWWNMQEIPVPGVSETSSRRGTWGGQCFHLTCRHTGADWFNKQNGRYYCDECARGLNEMCLNEGLPKICTLDL